MSMNHQTTLKAGCLICSANQYKRIVELS